LNDNDTIFVEKKRRFFEKYDIKINPKTRKLNKEFYVDQNQKFQLGRIPPQQITIKDSRKISICKFCHSPLPETEDKGHGKRFCNSRCQQEYHQTRKKLNELQAKDPNITMILRYPKKENPNVELSKTQPIQRHQMDIVYKDFSKKPLTTKKGKRKNSR